MKNRRRISPFWILLGLAWAGMCSAVTTVEPYSARVAVADESDSARADAFRTALAQVVVKLAGQRRVLDLPGVGELLAGAADLVEEYRYQPRPVDAGTPTAAGATTEESSAAAESSPAPGPVSEPLDLIVRFAAPTLDAEWRRLGLPLWPSERAPVLLWIATADEDREAVAALARTALEVRGAPVLEPLWDLQDTMTLGDGGPVDAAKMAMASSRYEAKRWLALAPIVAANDVTGAWLLGGDAPASGKPAAKDLPAWVEAAVNAAIDDLAATETYLPGGQTQELDLILENIPDYGAYRAAVDALKAIEVVRAVKVKAMSTGQLAVVVQLDGEPTLLWRALAENPHFESVTTGTAPGGAVDSDAGAPADAATAAPAGATDSAAPPQSAVPPATPPATTDSVATAPAAETPAAGAPETTATPIAAPISATAAAHQDGTAASAKEHRYRWREP